ncbi:Uncharacterised protein [Niallia circulans]|nr:Uncharacterised protein [Niallia circulans]
MILLGYFPVMVDIFLICVLVYVLMIANYQTELIFIKVHSLYKKHYTGLRTMINRPLKVGLKDLDKFLFV